MQVIRTKFFYLALVEFLIISFGALIAVPASAYTAQSTHTHTATAHLVTKKKVVSKKKKTKKKSGGTRITPKPKPSPYQATLLIASAHELRLAPGEEVVVRFGFKNSGTKTWGTRALQIVVADSAQLNDGTWATSDTPVRVADTTKPGRLEFFDVPIRAPDTSGDYVFQARLMIAGVSADGGAVAVPLSVVQSETQDAIVDDTAATRPEPPIRVALGTIEGAMLVHTVGDYTLKTIDGQVVAPVPDGSKIVWQYDVASQTYMVSVGDMATSSQSAFRLEPNTPDARFVVHDHADHPAWNDGINYDEFRGALELRYSDKIPGVWVINELPIEAYLKGLIETNKTEPTEYQKSVMIAARSYAYIFLPDGKTYVNRLWDVHAKWDQYYKGYRAEVLNPVGAAAVDATRGEVVTYNNKPVITPYFARSDGMTRGWHEVWGGADKPWLMPVVALYDRGKTMFGHGVGMSQTDARAHAAHDGWSAEQILSYYYAGTVVKKVYGAPAQ